jgi:hypothetical protein
VSPAFLRERGANQQNEQERNLNFYCLDKRDKGVMNVQNY